ncbi:MAG TPA: carboxypeptidase-like regulatory domain-containing protein, partial [Mariniphaga sp.]|nr:carboxypeptidase-like regulatory domain-containing protein [Mariniphaga sp.]
LISLNVLSQQASVSGLITDTSGQPLPGVTVAVKGTTQGTVTNQDGEYILNNVPGDAVLVVSFVGMRTQEISVNGRTVINASLSKEAIGLDEVVVTALGITRDKKQLNYSIQQIDGELVGTTGNIDVSRGLQGKIAGVTVRQTSGAPGKTPKADALEIHRGELLLILQQLLIHV